MRAVIGRRARIVRAIGAIVLGVVVACLAGRAAAATDALARVRTAGVLRWGGDRQGGEPYVFEDPREPSRLVGFEVDVVDSVARELGVRAEFVQNDWSNLVPSLERGAFDVAVNGLEITEARRGRVRFSRPYYVFAERLMVRDDTPRIAPTLGALEGKRVGTLANSLAFEMLRGTGAETVLYEGVEEPYADLVNERTDAVLLDDVIASRYGASKPELRVAGDLRDGYYAMAVRPSEPELERALSGALATIEARGDLRAILEKYGLWNERQAKLSAAPSLDSTPDSPNSPPTASATFDRPHVLLFLRGAGVTLFVSILAMAIATPFGVLLALARRYGGPWVARAASVYVEIYRGTPVLLQLYLLYYGLAPVVRLGALPAAILGLGMNYAAYEAEVFRAGIQAVPKTQLEAAWALGMSTRFAVRRVVLPQALRFSIPNVTNDFIALLKDSSLVSVITVVELTKQMTITAVDVRSWLGPGLLCAALYFAMSYPLGRLARRLERALEGRSAAKGEDA